MTGIVDIQVAYYNDLNNGPETEEMLGGFNSFSYGDAEYTLVSPVQLTTEIEDFLQDIDSDENREILIGTITALKEIPPNVLVAVEG